MGESDFLDLLKQMPLHDGARGLCDDAATIQLCSQNIIFTKDMMVQGVHYFDDADPADVAWKLLAVNLSDLAAKGAKPIGVMLGYVLGDDDWDRSFAAGFNDALNHYDVPLIGGDTVGLAGNAAGNIARILSLTAIGTCDHDAPVRGGAKEGDILYVSGPLGDAYGGYEMVQSGDYDASHPMVLAYNRPVAQILLGQEIARGVNAMMDISDGLLIDAQRMAEASDLQLHIDLERIPLSQFFNETYGRGKDAILRAATWGDDYQLLCAASARDHMPAAMVPIGRFSLGQFWEGQSLEDRYVKTYYHGAPIPLPQSLGYQHDD